MNNLNAAAIVFEIGTLHDAYERALQEHDTAALARFFWDSPHTVRYGVAEHLYGAAAIAAYRQGGGPVFTDRQLVRRAITTFGTDVASVMCEFTQVIQGQARHSRQSQVWIRFADQGWRIVSAHVSNAQPPAAGEWTARAAQAAAVLGLPLAAAHLPGVAQHLERSAALARPLLEFPLPADLEPAPVFQP